MKKKRLLKPKTVLAKWEALLEKRKPKRPTKKERTALAAMCGMKSIGEVRCAADMDARGIKWEYEAKKLQFQYEVENYTPDFHLGDYEHLVIEYKGKLTKEIRKKMKAVQKCNPTKRICFVFERANNKLTATKNSWRYWQWAERNNFLWSEGVIKDEWLN